MSIDKGQVAALRGLSEKRQDMVLLDPRILAIEDGYNPRNYNLPQNKEHLMDLVESIRENGVMQPLWVRMVENVPTIVDGECRWRATMHLIEKENLDIKAVPVILKSGDEGELLLASLTANTGKPLSQWEIGTAFKRFQKLGWTVEDIAKSTGYKADYVNKAIELSSADKEMKALLSEAAVTPAHALNTIRTHGGQATMVIKARIAQKKAENEKKQAERQAAKDAKAADKPAKGKKTAAPKEAKPKKEKPVKLAREKKVNSAHVKFSDIKVIIELLEYVKANPGEGDDAVDRGTSAGAIGNRLKKLLPVKEEKE